MSGNAITIQDVRFSYCHLFTPRAQKPDQDPKYSVTLLLPKTNTQGKAQIDQAIARATEAGVNKCWNGTRPPRIPIPVHDGDGVRQSGEPFGAECRGCWVFTASSTQKPFVVDANVHDIINPVEVYSGMYGNVSVTFFPYSNNGRRGIGCGLNGIQKVRDGEPLDNRVTATEAFKPVMTETSGYGGAPAAVPAYGATSGYGTPAQAPDNTPPWVSGTGVTQKPRVNPFTGELLDDGYTPQGFPVAGI